MTSMKKKIVLTVTAFIIIFFMIFLDRIVDFIINIKWFMEVNYLSIYFTQITATLKLMIPVFLISYIGIWIYYKSLRNSAIKKAKIVELNPKGKKVERNIFVIINAIISFFISYAIASTYWYRILQFTNANSFNVKDPIYGIDVSFYVFKLPLLESLYAAAMSLLVLLVFITLAIYFFMVAKDSINYKDLRNPFSKVRNIKSGLTNFAGKQLAGISSLILLLLSLGYVMKALNLVYSDRGVVFGAGYTDVNVTRIFYGILFVVCLISSIIVFISVLKSKVKPIIASIAVIVVLVVGESIVATAVQGFIVKPNEKTLEQKYIKNNIDYTRKAFNIDDIQEEPFDVKNNLTKDDIKNNRGTIDNIKINSFNQALEFYNQVQVIRYYYGFNDIDVDRYNINGKYNQVFIAPREINLDSLEGNAATWQNKHLIYTHGYGVVMSNVKSVTAEGQPDFVIKDIPPENNTDIPLNNPRIYFGEKTNDYAIVNTNINEFDYPKGGENQYNKYEGKAGINMTLFNRILFTIKEKNINFLTSRDINSNSKILINRNVVDRIKRIAPFLTYDKDSYVVIANGKLYWILDAYTVSDRYPYSQPVNGVNYIRNSVKVVVDATDGTTNFYIMDKNDPIANSYSKIFPDLFKDVDTVPKDIKDHFRYPEGLFNIECDILGKYHMTDPGVFYNSEDLWQIAQNQKTVGGEKVANEPFYAIMKLPKGDSSEMILVNYFNMRNKDNMVAFFGARMDKDNYGKKILYKFPPQKTVYSPLLFNQRLNQDTTISKEISLWNKDGSEVIYGDTMILPINESLLYVEPVYLRATGKNSIPEMKRVVVSYADKMVITENIETALEQLFNIEKTNTQTQAAPQQQPAAVTAPNVNAAVNNETKQKLKLAKENFDKAIEAQKAGEWAKYGEYIKKLQDTLNDLNK